MQHRIVLLLLGLILLVSKTEAQNDSTLQLIPERLGFDDIQERKAEARAFTALSATRSPEKIEEIPFTVWVITNEDILLNGFVTLADVLRSAPGMRTSQPGNAIEGETFMMRGLSGNQYMKILINDVPIKPSVALGMPIGAQLPIRQAERIEVYYGPASAIYGNEAYSGVVNIILKETERPIFTQADLSFGNMGYNSLDLTFGGKLGKDKNILRFTIYGSSTIRESSDIYEDLDIFKLNRYLPFNLDTNLYVNFNNFRAQEPGDSLPKLIPIPHESRMFGLNLHWRGIKFSYHRMARTDFSGLGLNPLSVSYSNPSNLLSERLESFSLAFNVHKKRFTTSNTISVLRYNVDRNSTASYIFDQLSVNLYRVRLPEIQNPAQATATQSLIYQRFNSDERYFASRGLDTRLESVLHTNFTSTLSMDLGATGFLGIGAPVVGHFRFPFDLEPGGITSMPTAPYQIDGSENLEGNLFAQLDLHYNRFRMIGGSGLNFSSLGSPEILPRIAAQYSIDSSWHLRGSFATGIRRPSIYSLINTLAFRPNLNVELNSAEAQFRTERNQTLEGGLRYIGEALRVDAVFFAQNHYNLAQPGQFYPSFFFDSTFIYGFRSGRGLNMRTWGIQSQFLFDTGEIPVTLSENRVSSFRWRNEFNIQY
ncbi:MAG: TonB-dependent receptor [Saprospiraceae bacterium]